VRGLLDTWLFTRERLRPSYSDLGHEDLLWRPFEGAHSIGELLYHIAGAEHYYAARISGRNPAGTDWEAKLDRAVVDDFLAEGKTPFGPDDMHPQLVEQALEFSALEIRPILENPTQGELSKTIVSALGASVTGYEGLLRVTQHAAYHTGQIWIYRKDPRFPGGYGAGI
jgi:uncharacterized damage-inducible protein DinB